MKVKRAIIMAAGKGSRMFPLTGVMPKPLVKIGGIPMIETIIRALHQNGITEIYIVVGYLKEQYRYLIEKYCGIRLLYNPYYSSCNNISSLYVACDYLENAFIIDGDQVIFDQNVLRPEFERSGYNVVWSEQETNEWLLYEEEGIVTGCSRTGGREGWQLYGISRWSSEDGKRLRKHVKEEFNIKKNTDIYWDDLALFCYPEAYHLGITTMVQGDVIEIDTLEELYVFEPGYERTVEDLLKSEGKI